MSIAITPGPAAARVPPARSPLVGVALAAFAVFTLAAALYPMFASTLSGQGVMSQDALASPAAPDAGATAHLVGPVHLEPGMAPLRALVLVEHPGRLRRDVVCRVTMRDAGGRQLWSESRDLESYAAGLNARRTTTTVAQLEDFAVPAAGEYTFVLDAGSVRELRFELRSGVARVYVPLVYAFAALALASLALVLFAASQSPRPVRHDA